MAAELLLPIIFFFIALLYSSIGFGGGSSYLAILSLFLTNFLEIRSTALILNLTVVSIGTVMYFRHRVFDWKLFWPFLLPSIPMAYLGTQIRLSEKSFFLILGFLLLTSGLALIYKFLRNNYRSIEFGLLKRLGFGGGIGFLAGISGIGGGIYLSPVLNMIGWKDSKKIASLASAFIWVNSLAGIIGLLVADSFQLNTNLSLGLIASVTIGGLLGSTLSNQKFNNKIIGLLTAILVIYVGIRILLKYGYGVLI